MDVISFLCVLLGSSTVQLHDSLRSRRACMCSEAGFSSPNRDCLRTVVPKISAVLCGFLWTKLLHAKDISKEMFLLYGGKCLSHKAVHNWVEKFSQGRSNVADDARPGAEVSETTIKRLLCCGKAMGEVYKYSRRICREINVFSCFEYHMFYDLYPFVSYLLTLIHTSAAKPPSSHTSSWRTA
jgi:hypothetical protein